jgi:hypothetical protein
MKNLFKITVLVSFFVIFSAFDSEIPQKQEKVLVGETINLEKAISDKLISVNFVSNGQYAGKSIIAEMRNLTATAIKICVPAGTYFQAPSDKEQDLLIPQDEYFALFSNQKKSITLNGFCTNLANKSPKEGGKFKLAADKTPKEMAKLLTFLKGKKYEDHTLQDAIWSITNQSSVSSVYGEDAPGIESLRKHLFEITKQKETWYTSPQTIEVLEDGTINRETASIKGDLIYTTKKGAKVHSEVVNPEGVVKIKTNQRTMEISGELSYNFKVEVQGWKKGTYKVNVIEDNKVIKTYDFVV